MKSKWNEGVADTKEMVRSLGAGEIGWCPVPMCELLTHNALGVGSGFLVHIVNGVSLRNAQQSNSVMVRHSDVMQMCL